MPIVTYCNVVRAKMSAADAVRTSLQYTLRVLDLHASVVLS